MNYFDNLECRIVATDNIGSAIIMIPGFGCEVEYCFRNIRELSKNHNLYMINLPWHAQSEGPLEIEAIQESLQKMREILNREHDSVKGIGHSLGPIY